MEFRLNLMKKMNTKLPFQNIYCKCKKDEKSLVPCRGGYFCRYGGKYHPHCLGYLYKTVYRNLYELDAFSYCRSCEDERLNEEGSISAINRVLAEFDESLILDAVISNSIRFNST